ncbi:UNVERIFIED_CONTAM: Pentatricopeptide repeat-containing protein, chloroplastic [Sesamum angustifolium]|uniref:Pentatricopeptide repeat-containing protein, chloroplastic n=1 Tax=Sesamum angustifolium TaxID=2727405 RepID=A0AAW2P018_9LAMI
MQLARLASLLDKSLTTDQAMQIHCQIVVNRLNDLEPLLIRQTLNSVARYSPRTAHYVKAILRRMQKSDVFATSFTIRYLCQHGQFREALSVYEQMHSSGLFPNTFAMSSALKACARILCKIGGLMIHGQVQKCGFCKVVFVQTALVDFYSKIGDMMIARKVFDEITGKNVVSWNSILAGLQKRDLVAYTAMILGYGINGRGKEAIELFEEMMDADIIPNLVTFMCILTAYNHVGLVEEGYRCFMSMQRHGLLPSQDHYAIVVDLLGRAGRLEEAHELIKKMPMQPHAGVWGALLLACSLHNNVELAEFAWKNCCELEPDSSGYHSLLANIYASVGRWDDAKRLRRAVEEKGLVKIPGSSWTECFESQQ